MRNAEIVLGVIHERGTKGLPLEGLYRQLYNPSLYLLAYGRIYRNAGAMTPGATKETVDGMSLAKIGRIIDALRHERYRWAPARRVYIEKKGSKKMRPLGIPSWSDKLLQEVIRLLLEAYYNPQFNPASHGFRPKLGCHTALREVYHKWVGTKWFIEGDIAQCFDSLDHEVLLSILREKIHDNRFLRLIGGLLEYYRLASNLYQLNRLRWLMERSLTHTLAQKLCISVRGVYRRYRQVVDTGAGRTPVLQVTVERKEEQRPLVARWGGISLAWNIKAVINDAPLRICGPRTEIERRLLANQCELCGSTENIQVHHVRALKDLQIKGRAEKPFWVQVMAARKRKTLVTCKKCHDDIHAGRPTKPVTANGMTLESRVLRKA